LRRAALPRLEGGKKKKLLDPTTAGKFFQQKTYLQPFKSKDDVLPQISITKKQQHHHVTGIN